MNSRIFIKTIVILAILWLSLLAYNSIDEWAVWRDIPEDFVDIEDVNREISGKETYAYVLASIPFVGLLVAFILLLNSIRKDIYRNKKR